MNNDKYWRVRIHIKRDYYGNGYKESIFVSAQSMKAARKKAEELLAKWKRGIDMRCISSFPTATIRDIFYAHSVTITKVESVAYDLISQYQIY